MELRHLRYFTAVAETLNFRKASARLHVSQPPLSMQIKQLEEEIGTPLFLRTNKSVTLTEAGATFYERAKEILASVETAKQDALDAANGITGHIRIFYVSSAMAGFLEKPIERFTIAYPNVTIELKQSTSERITRQLKGDELDIGIVRLPYNPGSDAKLTILKKECFVLAMSKNHPLAKRKSLKVSDIAGEPLIMTPRRVSPDYHDFMLSLFQKKGLSPNVTIEAIEQFSISGLAAANIGIAIVPETMRSIHFPNLVHIPLEGTANKTGFGALTAKAPNVFVSNFISQF